MTNAHDHDDFATEPVPGLPEALPAGEHILWQGAPHWIDLALKAFHVRTVAIYFTVLMVWRGWSVSADGGDAATVFAAATSLLPLALIAIALLALAARMTAKATLYTITNRRVVMRIGVALTKTINIPFKVIAAAALQPGARGRGDIALELVKPNRIGLFHLWPNARPWHVNAPQPTLRAVWHVTTVAAILGRAMQAELGATITASAPVAAPATIPQAFPAGPAGVLA